MIPFSRTVVEAERVVGLMAEFGLKQGEHDLEIYAMCELPANVIYADEFLRVFDGYSIGSNDLTQLTLSLNPDTVIQTTEKILEFEESLALKNNQARSESVLSDATIKSQLIS